ncbi:MAG TPA: HPr family phosphocarrier protein [Ktedonobacteraceae bacterium]|nr:HPr family phosphocarrier protein [Ktedonobacteraceae bacterium]
MEHAMERAVILGNKAGLHARPAAIFVQQAQGFQCQITLSKNGKTANGKSILSILTLGAEQGDQIILTADGADAEAAIDRLTLLLEAGAE